MKKLLILLLFISFYSFGQHGVESISNAVNINGNLVVDGTITGSIITPKAFAYLDSNTNAITITQNVWTKIENFTEGGESGVISFDTNTMFITLTGDYQAKYDPTSTKGSGASAYFEFGFSINGAIPLKRHRTGRQIPGADVGSKMISRTMSLTDGDNVSVWTINRTNNDDITIRYGEFELIKE